MNETNRRIETSCNTVCWTVLVVVVLVAVVFGLTSDPVEGDDGTVAVECPAGYENCIGTPISKEKVIKDLDWCNVAWTGVPDQYRAAYADGRIDKEGLEKLGYSAPPEFDSEYVVNWKRNESYWGNEWVLWDAWETEKQRELRIAVGGWITCEHRPKE